MRRLLVPIPVLGSALAIAWVIHPSPLAVALFVLIAAGGGARSLSRQQSWNPADDITTLRLGLIVVFTALVLADGASGFAWPAVVIGALALALDACDGWVARRTISTPAGAAYDEAVDAMFVLILSIALVPVWGLWCVLPGLLHYLYRAVGVVRPAWRRPLPPSRRRKIVAAAQGILLLTAGSPLAVSAPSVGWLWAGAALAFLLWSFGADIVWLERKARQSGPRGPCP